ncbi:MAG: rhombosortase [bacterium]
MSRYPVTLVLTLIAIGFSASQGFAPVDWVYDRNAVLSGEWWRILTGHFVHSDFEHAFWDITVFALLGLLLEQWGSRQLAWSVLTGMLGVNLMLLLGLPWLDYYCGLSGVINTMLVVVLGLTWRSTRGSLVLVIGLGVLLKIATESVLGYSLLTDTAWPGVPQAHLAGFITGGLFVLVCCSSGQTSDKGKSK